MAIVLAGLLVACEQQKKEEAPAMSKQNTGDANNDVVHVRAVEAMIWGMPAVNYDLEV